MSKRLRLPPLPFWSNAYSCFVRVRVSRSPIIKQEGLERTLPDEVNAVTELIADNPEYVKTVCGVDGLPW